MGIFVKFRIFFPILGQKLNDLLKHVKVVDKKNFEFRKMTRPCTNKPILAQQAVRDRYFIKKRFYNFSSELF